MTMPFIDFAALKERVTMEQVISLLNVKVTKIEGAQWRAQCPACRSGGDRVLSMNVREKVYRCFADGGKGGDVIALVAHVRGTSQREAAEFLNDRFPDDNSPRHVREHRREEAEGPPPGTEEAFEDFNLEIQRRFDDLEKRVTALEENKIIHLKRRT
jgi:DNA primase